MEEGSIWWEKRGGKKIEEERERVGKNVEEEYVFRVEVENENEKWLRICLGFMFSVSYGCEFFVLGF